MKQDEESLLGHTLVATKIKSNNLEPFVPKSSGIDGIVSGFAMKLSFPP